MEKEIREALLKVHELNSLPLTAKQVLMQNSAEIALTALLYDIQDNE